MECSDIISICAIIAGPIFAVQIEKYLERRRENKNRRLSIFKTLMATRGTVLSWDHVEALNRIDLEFSGNKKFEKVIQAWKVYFDNLSQKYTPEEEAFWVNKNRDLLADLLYEMGHSLGFGFDKTRCYPRRVRYKREERIKVLGRSKVSQQAPSIDDDINYKISKKQSLVAKLKLKSIFRTRHR